MPTLSDTARQQFYYELGKGLPRARTFEDHERRHLTAIEAFQQLNPGDAWEGRLAVQSVLAAACGADSMDEAAEHKDDFAKFSRCRAQGASLMRTALATRRMLSQEQKRRLGVEAVATAAPEPRVDGPAAPPVVAAEPAVPPVRPVAAPSSTATPPAHVATPPITAPAPRVPVPAPRVPAPPRAAAVSPAQPQPVKATQPISPEALAAAHTFMRQHPAVAAQIRMDRGITQKCRTRWHAVLPADPAVTEALIRTPRKLLIAHGMANDTLSAAA